MATTLEGQTDLAIADSLTTELERLMAVWGDLTAQGETVSVFDNLVSMKIRQLKLRCTSAQHVISLNVFRRLIAIHKSLVSSRSAEATDRAGVIAFIEVKVKQKMDSHPSKFVSDFVRRPTPELFEDMEFWSALKNMLEGSFNISKVMTNLIDNIISLDLAACSMDVVATPALLRVVEIGAELMKVLPQQHQSKIIKVVNSHMRGLAVTNDKLGAGHVHHVGEAATVGIDHDGVAKAGAQASKDLPATKNSHAKGVAEFEAQIRCLQEQAVQYKATISKLNQAKNSWTQKRIGYEGQVHGLTQELSSIELSRSGIQQENIKLRSELDKVQSENVDLAKKSENAKSEYHNMTCKLEAEVGILEQALLDQDHANDTDDRIYDESFQGRAEKLAEELAEAEEDKVALAKDTAAVSAEKARVEEALAKSEEDKIAMANETRELCMKTSRLDQELRHARASLEEVEDKRAGLSREVEDLANEKARLKNELTDAQDILRQIGSLSSSTQFMATNPLWRGATANVDSDTDSTTSSQGILTPPSSTGTTPR